MVMGIETVMATAMATVKVVEMVMAAPAVTAMAMF